MARGNRVDVETLVGRWAIDSIAISAREDDGLEYERESISAGTWEHEGEEVVGLEGFDW